jgi:hypothetical protein
MEAVDRKMTANKSLQPTRGEALGSSRGRELFYVAVPAWLSYVVGPHYTL